MRKGITNIAPVLLPAFFILFLAKLVLVIYMAFYQCNYYLKTPGRNNRGALRRMGCHTFSKVMVNDKSKDTFVSEKLTHMSEGQIVARNLRTDIPIR